MLLAACGSTSAIQTQAAPAAKQGTIGVSETASTITITFTGWPTNGTTADIYLDGKAVAQQLAVPGSLTKTYPFTCGLPFKIDVNIHGAFAGEKDDSNTPKFNCSPSTTGAPPSTTLPVTSAPVATTGAPPASSTTLQSTTIPVPPASSSTSSSAPPVASSLATPTTTAPPTTASTSPSTDAPPADGPPPTGLVIPPTCLQKCTP